MEIELREKPSDLEKLFVQLGFESDKRNKRKWYNGNICLEEVEKQNERHYTLEIVASDGDTKRLTEIKEKIEGAYYKLLLTSN